MHHFFIRLHQFIQKNKMLSIFIGIATLILLAFFASRIKFEEDINRIIPKNDKADITAKVLKQVKFSDKITIIIQKDKNASVGDLTQTADAFLEKIPVCDQYIKNIQGKLDEENIQETFQFVYQNLPLFLEKEDYKLIENKIQSDSIKKQVVSNFNSLISPTGIVSRDFIVNDPLGLGFIALKKLQQLNVSEDFTLENGYVVSKDKSTLLLFINPILSGSETEKNTLFAEKLYQIQTELNTEFKDKTSVDYFGSSLIAVANAKQIKSDIITTVLISITALMLILILFYRKIYIPVIIFIPTLFGVAAALASLYFLKTTISAISLSVGAVLLGVTIDYSLHIMTHYRHNANLKELYKDITMPLLMSSSTTALAFLCLLFVNSEALQDLGIFAAISVMISAFFSLVIIPHLYKPSSEIEVQKNTILDKMAQFPFEKNKFLIIASIILIVISLFTFNKVTFNNNLGNLNFIPSEIKNAEAKLEATSNLTSKSIYVTSYGNTIDEALENNYKLHQNLSAKKAENSILNFNSIGSIVLPQAIQNEKIQNWKEFWSAQKINTVKNQLIVQGNLVGFKPSTHEAFYHLLANNFKPLSVKEYQELKPLFLDEFISSNANFHTITSVVKLNEKQRDTFIKQIEKENQVITIDRQHMNETFLGKLRDDFTSLVNYSFIAVILILFVFFRRIELVIVSTIPIAITGIVTAGLMYWFNIQFNIFSLIVCTLIFGHGVDFSIFMTSALQKEYTTGKNEMPTYRTSIILAALTTILAIGALIFAKHPALKSISSVALMGVLAALVITFIFYPIIFRFFFFNRVKKGKSPVPLFTIIHSALSLLYYSLGGIILSITLRFLVWIIPGKMQTKMLVFRKIMAKFVTSVLYTNPFVKKTVVSNPNEDFSKPAIVIANHTSVLDTLALGMVTHKIVYLVNDWVWKSPIFGKAVRAMGYYPVSQGVERSVDHLKDRVNEGYSLMVFPEGTRSESNQIMRFHKGAFFLAQEFNLDILPIYIHGNSETSPKGDFMIFNEQISVIIGDRIKADEISFGTEYGERTKKINKKYREEFSKIRSKNEDENYFKQKLFLSFLYKEQEIVEAVKIDFNKKKSAYFELNNLISEDAKIAHIGNDFGQIDFLLAINQPKRKIFSYILNEENRGIAQTNYLVQKRNIQYLSTNEIPFEKVNTIVISHWNSESNIDLSNYLGNQIIFIDIQKDIIKNISNFKNIHFIYS